MTERTAILIHHLGLILSKSYFSLDIQVQVTVFKKVIEKRELKNNQSNIVLLPLHPLLLYTYQQEKVFEENNFN